MKNPRLLRHLVTIQTLAVGSPQQMPNGEDAAEWGDFLINVSAEWITLSGAALLAAQGQHAEVRGIWRIRWRDSITAGMRVVHAGKHYDILFVPPYDRDGKKLNMELSCSEGVNDG